MTAGAEHAAIVCMYCMLGRRAYLGTFIHMQALADAILKLLLWMHTDNMLAWQRWGPGLSHMSFTFFKLQGDIK